MDGREVIKDSWHAFTKDKSCLLTWRLSMRVMTLVDKENPSDVICLDFGKAFDTVPHNTLVSTLERDGFE